MKRRLLHKIGSEISVPSLLNFPSGNNNSIDAADEQYKFSGEFYIEVDFEYASVTSSYAGVTGFVTGITVDGACRLLINNSTILLSIVSNTNLTKSQSTSYNTRYVIRYRRDSSDNIYISVDGGSETLLGVRSGNVEFRHIGLADNTPRYLRGKVYGFDINGEVYDLTEGSGNIVNGSNGGTMTIITDDPDGVDYIDAFMWEAL